MRSWILRDPERELSNPRKLTGGGGGGYSRRETRAAIVILAFRGGETREGPTIRGLENPCFRGL